MPVSATDIISPAFQHMKKQLFQPFRLGVWARYGVLGLATGEALSGGCGSGGNFNVPAGKSTDHGSEFLAAMPALPEHFWVYLALGVVAVFALMVVGMYVSSVLRFVLFESVLTGEVRLRKGWRKWQEQGLSFFGFQLALMLVMCGTLALLIGVPLLAIYSATKGAPTQSQHLGPMIFAIVLLVFAFFIVAMFALLITVLVKDFVVPIMAMEHLPFTDAVRRFWPMLKGERGGFAGYIGMKIVLAIGAAFITGIVFFVTFLVLAIPGALMGGAAVLCGNALGWAWTPLTITLAAVGITIFVFALLYLVGSVCSPVTVFFTAYGIYFLAGRYPALAAILYPPPPQEPPASPLSPEPEPQPAM